MPVLKPKNRVIVFRISEDDYRKVQQLSDRVGARSLSEYARTVLLRSADPGGGEPQTLTALATRLSDIEAKLDRLGRKEGDRD